jgi:hypothetical protein
MVPLPNAALQIVARCADKDSNAKHPFCGLALKSLLAGKVPYFEYIVDNALG